MEIKVSQLKTDIEGFNSMPSRRAIEKELENEIGIGKYLTVDLLEREFWFNKDDTLVIKLNPLDESRVGSMILGIRVGRLQTRLSADEFDYLLDENCQVIVRMWWDYNKLS